MGEKQTTGVGRGRLGHTWGSQGTLPASLGPGPAGGLGEAAESEEPAQLARRTAGAIPAKRRVLGGGAQSGREPPTSVSGSAESPRKTLGLDSDRKHPSHQMIQFHEALDILSAGKYVGTNIPLMATFLFL